MRGHFNHGWTRMNTDFTEANEENEEPETTTDSYKTTGKFAQLEETFVHSPGLRGRSYPGRTCVETHSTLKGLWHASAIISRHKNEATTLSGLGSAVKRLPRVARSSQPWALVRNPFGILLRNRWALV